MKLRQTTALALVGWYLMMPPMSNDPYYPKRAPLSHWGTFESFDTATDCRDFQADTLKRTKDIDYSALRKRALNTKELTNNLMRYAAMFGKCIASDDPRLKEK